MLNENMFLLQYTNRKGKKDHDFNPQNTQYLIFKGEL